jgi:hypothetical protein
MMMMMMMRERKAWNSNILPNIVVPIYARVCSLSFVRPKNETLKHFFSQFEFDLARASSLFHARATSALVDTHANARQRQRAKEQLSARAFSLTTREREREIFIPRKKASKRRRRREEKQTQFEFFFQFNF